MPALSELPQLPYRQWFPWLQLFRAGGLAAGWPQLGISFLAVAVFWAGMNGLDWSFRSAQLPRDDVQVAPGLIVLFLGKDTGTAIAPAGLYESRQKVVDVLCVPWFSLKRPLMELVFDPQENFPGAFSAPKPSRWKLCLTLCWSVIVWSLFGTAICRAAAVLVAKDQSESLPNALWFAGLHWTQALTVPLVPAAGILVLAAGLTATSWLGRLPWLGTPVLTLLSPLLLLAGVAIAFLTLLILFGWPLMISAMGIDDCDGFGALSRTYSFLTGKPAHAVWNVAVSTAFGGILVALFGELLTGGLLALSHFISGHVGTWERWQTIMNSSHRFAQWMLLAFAVSLFWSLATLNYLLLRQAVDGKPFDDIAPEDLVSSGRRELPVVGIPAADLPPEERSRLLSEAEAVATAT